MSLINHVYYPTKKYIITEAISEVNEINNFLISYAHYLTPAEAQIIIIQILIYSLNLMKEQKNQFWALLWALSQMLLLYCDSICIQLIQLYMPFLFPFIAHINTCTEESYFPSLWQHTFVILLQKHSNPTDFSHLPSTRVLPAFSKVLEKII